MDRWAVLRKVTDFIKPTGLPETCPSHVGTLKFVATGAARSALPGKSVAILPKKLDLSGDIFLRENAGIFDVLIRSLAEKRPAFVLSGTLKNVQKHLGVDVEQTLCIRITATGLIVGFGHLHGTPVAVHAAVTDDCRDLIRRLCTGTQIGTAALPDLVPEVLARETHRLIAKRLEGESPMPWCGAEQILQSEILAGLKPLEMLYRQKATHVLPDSELIPALQRFSEKHNRREDLRAGSALLETWDRSGLPAVTVHGDYWLNNLIVSAGRISGILDWDRARVNGCTAFDALHLGFMSYAMWADIYVSDLLASLWTEEWQFPWLQHYSERISAMFQVSMDDLRRIAAVLWLSYFYQGEQSPSAEWEKRMLKPVCRALALPQMQTKKMSQGAVA